MEHAVSSALPDKTRPRCNATGVRSAFGLGDLMTVDTVRPSVFDAGLPTLDYDLDTTPAQLYPQALAAQQQAPIALGPFGPEILSYELIRTLLRDPRFQIPPGLSLAA